MQIVFQLLHQPWLQNQFIYYKFAFVPSDTLRDRILFYVSIVPPSSLYVVFIRVNLFFIFIIFIQN